MKAIIIGFLGYLMIIVGKIWAIVSLLGWLFSKFDAFNWWSVVLFIVGWVVLFRAWAMD